MKRIHVTGLAAVAAILTCAVWTSGQQPMKTAADETPMNYRSVPIPLRGTDLAFVKKGDHVDVMVTFDALMKDKAKEKVTATILQYVKVADIKRPEKMDEKGVVLLVVNPNEAQYLALGQYQGELQLAIRAEGDKKMAQMEMASFRKLFR